MCIYIYIYNIFYTWRWRWYAEGWLVKGSEKVNKKRRPLLRKSMRPTFAGLPVNVMRNPHIYGQSVQNLAKLLCSCREGVSWQWCKKLPFSPLKKYRITWQLYSVLYIFIYYYMYDSQQAVAVALLLLFLRPVT